MPERYPDVGLFQQIMGLNLVPRKNATFRGNDTSLSDFSEMWYGVFLWATVSSVIFHLPAALLALATLRQHKVARFMPIAIMLMSIVGPVCGGVLTSESRSLRHQSNAHPCCLAIFRVSGAAIAGVYKAAGKKMIPLEALVFGVGQSFCVLTISFFRVLATL
ncbi:transmembrane protein 170A isoform X1 [Synchiropus splendidus]|uniref:transmembrane protein 170A isoform X1 n=1 Tax=Synchiropus splendidus TaxID=270530 RepID=UPI00237D9414|nr:transmembrane protein 170A isoform X1 [Synchiropus splendidus]